MSRYFSFVWRMLRRDIRAGELHLLLAALLVAVAAMTAVGFVTDRVQQALDREASQLLGGDLLLRADHPWPDALRVAGQKQGLQVVATETFPSMVSIGAGETARAQLAEIKAVEAGYPLRGSLRVADTPEGEPRKATGVPKAGSVWIDERLASLLPAKVGDQVSVGQRQLRVDAILTFEPDRGVNFFSVAPRLMLALDDLPSTNLVQPGSRVSYRLLFAGEAAQVQTFRDAIEKKLTRGERLEDAGNARPEIRTALDRAQRFVGIAALLTVVLAAVAVALAARRYLQRHLDGCAIMRCLGATQGFLLRAFLGQFAILGAVSAILGVALGYGTHFALYVWLARLLPIPLPPPGPLPALQGALVGVVLLLGFATPPILQLKRVPTVRVLRREFATGALPPSSLLASYALGLVALGGLMLWVAGDLRLGAFVVGGFVAALVVFALVARGFVRLLSRLRGRRSGVGWRYGLASLERHALMSVVQIVSLSLAFMALLLLTVIRNDLLDAWQRAIPPQAPNHFVVNIQPNQLDAVRTRFAQEGLTAEFAPMIRGRLVKINGQAPKADTLADEHARHMVEREFNLSYRMALPPGNSMTAGRWFTADQSAASVASVEDGLAKTLGLKVGDRLEFTVADEPVTMTVQSLRKLNWDSMRVNFFVLTPPGLLKSYPASWITSFYLPRENSGFVSHLVGEFPTLTVVDVAAILRQIQDIMDQVARAVQFVFLFTVLAGIIVLYAALATAAEERRYELSVMRALGARREVLRRALLTEFAAIGGVSGLIAALGAQGVGWLLAERVFHFQMRVDPALAPVAAMGGALLVCAAGWFAARRLLRTPPLEALRVGR